MATRKSAFKAVQAVTVNIWGMDVGAVALDPDTGYYAFEYEPRFVRSGIELSPLDTLQPRQDPAVKSALKDTLDRELAREVIDLGQA